MLCGVAGLLQVCDAAKKEVRLWHVNRRRRKKKKKKRLMAKDKKKTKKKTLKIDRRRLK